ncbi:hypothetical protein BJ138DRAFT_1011469 [Hygrophoropsis aurantiaca]|uniref:Uncharacterized protein n=1 Tax=Hygrophoropsis aurantiaca TaxID=72124 RepID=A0ACB8A7C3_9AGAM|nr:hypothetical protein BJ138DRAFT_1011469 [Hygrophoropsis aurantiaca]
MSLSRILNDEPPPSRPTNPGISHSAGVDSSSVDMSPRSITTVVSPSRSQLLRRTPSPGGEQPPPPRGYTYQPVSYQGVGGWDPYTGDWVQGDIFPLGRGGNYYSQRDRGGRQSHPPQDIRVTTVGAYYKEGDNDTTPRKRRKAIEEDSDYQPPGTKRVSLISMTLSTFCHIFFTASSSEESSTKQECPS